MRELNLIVRSEKLEDIKKILIDEFNCSGMTVTNVLGCGGQKGFPEEYVGTRTHVNLLPKLNIRVVVMYLGQIVEEANVDALFDHSGYPYTVGLIRSIPRIEGERAHRLYQIRGTVPMLDQIPTGCRFAPRCPYAQPRCFEQMPELRAIGPRQSVRCWRAGESFKEGGEA